MNRTGTIKLPTKSAIALWKHEVLGQLSDGMWENATPRDHWMFWHGLDVEQGDVAVEVIPTYRPSKTGYGLSTLIPVVGDRMLRVAKMSLVTDDEAIIRLADYLPDSYIEYSSLHEGSFYYEEISKIPADVIKKFYETSYTMKDLKRDLKHIKDAMKSASR